MAINFKDGKELLILSKKKKLYIGNAPDTFLGGGIQKSKELVDKKIKAKIYINVQGDEPLVNPRDIRKIINAKKIYPNHVICGYDKIHKLQDPRNLNLPKVVVNSRKELIYISRSLVPGSKKVKLNKNYFKQVCIYAFNKNELNKFYSLKKKSEIEDMGT